MFNDKNCPNGNKLRTYRLHKSRLTTEGYISLVPRHERSTLAKLRCGSRPLNIELGRFRNLPLESRICELCNSHNIEDEIHFTIDCSFYDDIRSQLFTKVCSTNEFFMELPSLAKYCYLMTDVSNIKSLAKTVDSMFKRRQTYM